jgi:hypothetical protein
MNNHYYKTQLLFNKLEQLKQYQLSSGGTSLYNLLSQYV